MTTYSEEKSPNAAPMGIIFTDEQKVIISPFLATQTFRNIERTKCAVINFVYDLKIFFESTFNSNRPKLPVSYFENATEVAAPCLKEAVATIEIQVEEIQKKDGRSRIKGEIISWKCSAIPFLPLNRGYYLTLESIVHTTRILEFQEDIQKVIPLIKLVKQYQNLIQKVAPTGEYIEIMKGLQKIIEQTGLWN